ncbi:MAG: methyltransferase [Pseudomonadota bacterium]
MCVELQIDPSTVFSPTALGEMFVSELMKNPLAGASVLDVGCGSGLIGIAAGKLGAEVTLLDVNPVALETAQMNAKANEVTARGVLSDGLDALKSDQTFDFIVANTPAQDRGGVSLSAPVSDGRTGGRLLNKLVKTAGRHLNPGGVFLTWAPDISDLKTVRKAMREHWDNVEICRQFEHYLCGPRAGLIDLNDDVERWVNEGSVVRTNEHYHGVGKMYALRRTLTHRSAA